MASTQQHLPIEDVRDGLVFLKDGSVNLVLATSAVNFGLLFETEQVAIINAFAGLLNSLSFSIQIVVHSKRLDVSSYLNTLDRAIKMQPNPLIKNITSRYRQFVQSLIKENNVLDKQFYVCINMSSAEIGILPKSVQEKSKKAVAALMPRRDHLIKQLARIGLKAKQLTTLELTNLYYDIYNPPTESLSTDIQATVPIQPKTAAPSPQPQATPQRQNIPSALPPSPVAQLRRPAPMPNQPFYPPTLYQNGTGQASLALPLKRLPQAAPNPILNPAITKLAPPFIVEELTDDAGP